MISKYLKSSSNTDNPNGTNKLKHTNYPTLVFTFNLHGCHKSLFHGHDDVHTT